ncbi:MAG: tetratricopeptide repeat protein [Acidobacteriota bacterium]|nr:tetratricopeptide repeat protein [Acidobacteriota bacterium]
MRTFKSLSVSGFAITVLGSFIFLNAACTQNNISASTSEQQTMTEKSENAAISGSSNPRIEAAQKLIEKNPSAVDGYNQLTAGYIQAAREMGDFSLNSKAEAANARALELEPQNLDALRLKATLLLAFHRFQEALEMGNQLRQVTPQDAFVYGVLTDANVELGNYPEAVKSAQQMVDLKPNLESYARVSYLRSLYGDSAGAINAMKTAAQIASASDKESRAWCLTHLGEEYFKIGKYAEAEKYYDSALQALPDYHLALAGKGRARAANNDFETAIKFLTDAQNRVPLTDIAISLGDIYTKIENSAEARKQYDLAEFIEQKFGNREQRTLALLWADQNRKLDEALEIARRESAERRDIYTADILAWCLYKKGDFAAAKKAIIEAMRLKTKDARILYHAGMIEKALGNRKAAADFFKQALETNPAFDLVQAENARQALTELNRNA